MKYIVAALIVGAIILGIFVQIKLRSEPEIIVHSPPTTLRNLWEKYKETYIIDNGRTIDPDRDSVTTSEGQSYAMLRAVWVDDKAAFDAAWTWTQAHLAKRNGLFSWIYGKKPDGTEGVLINLGGENSASDADTDIALALIFSYGRWGDETHLRQAQTIIESIWNEEVISIKGKLYLAANDIEKKTTSPAILINPSYLAPYAYRIFAKIDARHPWDSLVDSSLNLVRGVMESPLDRERSVRIPPDWAFINRKTGAIEPATVSGLTSNFSYDALRLPWRLALDWYWFRDDETREILREMNFLSEEWEKKELLASEYGHDGSVIAEGDVPALYGGTLGYFIVADEENAEEILKKKLLSWYNPDTNSWKEKLGYYNDNWVWFGMALYYQLIPNLTPQL